MPVTIRPERPGDELGIHAVYVAAFARQAEADLVDRLRDEGLTSISIVATGSGDVVVGHILFSPVALERSDRAETPAALGLGPMAVLPELQRQGVGAKLIRSGLEICRSNGADFVVVLGHPTYYPRLGFQRARTFGLANEYGADEAFMAVELRPGGIPAGGGLIRYARPFGEAGA